jgi:hypothetical protein
VWRYQSLFDSLGFLRPRDYRLPDTVRGAMALQELEEENHTEREAGP